MAAIYFHIPFCKQKCIYCDFFSCTIPATTTPVTDRMCAELASGAAWLKNGPVRTIYFGGGTPSLLEADTIKIFINQVKRYYNCGDLQEVTLEANPDDLDLAYLEKLLAAGVNRLSIGIQSFRDEDLRFLGRRHDARKAVQAVRDAARAGFSNITIDLMYGLPGMTTEIWRGNIEKAISLEVQHISAYHLSIEAGTPLAKMETGGIISAVSENESNGQYILLHNMLSGAGYEHYEISNFARPGFRSLHNSSYWDGTPYLGVGPGAHSFDGEKRRWAVSSIENYLRAGPGDIYREETLTPTDRFNETVMTRLRCSDGLDLPTLREQFGESEVERLLSDGAQYLETGWLAREADRLYIPTENFMVSDRIISGLFR